MSVSRLAFHAKKMFSTPLSGYKNGVGIFYNRYTISRDHTVTSFQYFKEGKRFLPAHLNGKIPYILTYIPYPLYCIT